MSRLVDFLVYEGAFCICDLKVTRKRFYKVFTGKNTIQLIDWSIDCCLSPYQAYFSSCTYGVIILEDNFVGTFSWIPKEKILKCDLFKEGCSVSWSLDYRQSCQCHLSYCKEYRETYLGNDIIIFFRGGGVKKNPNPAHLIILTGPKLPFIWDDSIIGVLNETINKLHSFQNGFYIKHRRFLH